VTAPREGQLVADLCVVGGYAQYAIRPADKTILSGFELSIFPSVIEGAWNVASFKYNVNPESISDKPGPSASGLTAHEKSCLGQSFLPRCHSVVHSVRHPDYNHARHFRIKSANTIGANDEVSRIENVSLHEIQHRTIGLRSLRLH
jgi:hypothetical protein